MLQMNDWMRLWGLDPKTGWPIVWQYWWSLGQPLAHTRTHIEIKIGSSPKPVVEKPMLKVDVVDVLADTDIETVLALEVVDEVAQDVDVVPAAAVAPTKVSVQNTLDLPVDERPKKLPVAKKTRSPRTKKPAVAAITPLVAEVVAPTVAPQLDVKTLVEDAPKQLEAPVLVKHQEAPADELVVKKSVVAVQDAVEKMVSASEKPSYSK